MTALLDAFWRAAAYCLHPRVMAYSLLPLLLSAGVTLLVGYHYWEAAVAAVRAALESLSLVNAMLLWLESIGGTAFRAMVAPLIVVALAVPVIVVLSLWLVAVLMTPALVSLVSSRRFPALERKRGAGLWRSLMWSLTCAVLALVAMAVTVPLWFVPPLVLVLPPLIWGWLAYRVMSFDVLADHASGEERHRIMREHRLPLLGIGIVSGLLGAAPSLLWAMSALTLVVAPLLVVASVWLYTVVFAFSALWFAHYALRALHEMRLRDAVVAAPPPPAPVEPVADDSTELLPPAHSALPWSPPP